MEREALKIGLRGIFFFCLTTVFCLRYHMKHIPEQLMSRCIQNVEMCGGQVSRIHMNGRHAIIRGTVQKTEGIDRIIDCLSSIPLLKSVDLNFEVPTDSVRQQLTRLSGRFILFPENSAEITPSSEDLLDSLTSLLAAIPGLHLNIRGWTDTRGDSAYNQKLSEMRASAVYGALVKRECDSTRLLPVGFGEQWPRPAGIPDSLARRVDFKFEE